MIGDGQGTEIRSSEWIRTEKSTVKAVRLQKGGNKSDYYSQKKPSNFAEFPENPRNLAKGRYPPIAKFNFVVLTLT